MVRLIADADLMLLESSNPEYTIKHICKEYHDAITDWCHHDLAIEVTAKNTGENQITVEKVIKVYEL